MVGIFVTILATFFCLGVCIIQKSNYIKVLKYKLYFGVIKKMTDNFIFDILDKFDRSSIVALDIKRGGAEISLKKAEGCVSQETVVTQAAPAAVPASPVASNVAAQVVSEKVVEQPETKASLSAPEKKDSEGITIKSPLVGTFYRAPSPDSPAYAEKGKTIHKGQPLCILEAMKMMNTLEAEFDCVIVDILATNGDLIEYDQPLFIVEKL